MNPKPDHFFTRISRHGLCLLFVLNSQIQCPTYQNDVNSFVSGITNTLRDYNRPSTLFKIIIALLGSKCDVKQMLTQVNNGEKTYGNTGHGQGSSS